MRYHPLTDKDREMMMDTIGIKNVTELFKDVPRDLLFPKISLNTYKSEIGTERHLNGIQSKNLNAEQVPFFIGAGAYRHHIPATVDHIIQRSEFLTSYTPYQPEIAQGTLQALFEFQTQVARMTGMEIANAGMYDGSTSTLEAVLMSHRITGRNKAILSPNLHPHYVETVKTVTDMTDFKTVVGDFTLDKDVSCVVVQNPDFFGNIQDYSTLADECHNNGSLLVVVFTEVFSLGLLSPGSMGADIVVGEGQSLGNPINFGGPYVGLFATNKKYVRQMPGRIVGQTTDKNGRRAFTLTLSTREQHIRREKATSNICTSSGLCALAFTIHASLLGGHGLRKMALVNHRKAVDLAKQLSEIRGVEVLNKNFFNEFTIKLNMRANEVVEKLVDENILGGVPVSRLMTGKDDLLLIATTEMNNSEDRSALINALKGILR